MSSIQGKNNMVKPAIRVTILNGCHTQAQELYSGNDFACIIQHGAAIILFGSINQGSILVSNMKRLGFDPKNIDLVYIAANHYDDLTIFNALKPDIPVLIPETITNPLQQALINNDISYMHIASEEEILPNIYSLGNFSWRIREQAIILKTAKGMIVIIGPTHYLHIGSILLQASDLFPGDPINMVICGFKASQCSDDERIHILEYFHLLQVQNVALCLNSDEDCRQLFELYFKNNYTVIGVGSVIDLNSDMIQLNLAAKHLPYIANQTFASL